MSIRSNIIVYTAKKLSNFKKYLIVLIKYLLNIYIYIFIYLFIYLFDTITINLIQVSFFY